MNVAGRFLLRHGRRGRAAGHRLAAFLAMAMMLLIMASPATHAAESRGRGYSLGTYNSPPRGADGRVDIARLLDQLQELGVNTYNWLIWHKPTDLDDLRIFLPLARQSGIKVWVTVVPPSESPPVTKLYSEPYRLDFMRWADEIGHLSITNSNLVAWSIDDFSDNLLFFNPVYLAAVVNKAREHNPALRFIPCMYHARLNRAVWMVYGRLLDGVLFPYTHASAGQTLFNYDTLSAELRDIRQLIGPHKALYLDVYASRHSTLGQPSLEYIEGVMHQAFRERLDGVHVYTHPAYNARLFSLLKRLFAEQRSHLDDPEYH